MPERRYGWFSSEAPRTEDRIGVCIGYIVNESDALSVRMHVMWELGTIYSVLYDKGTFGMIGMCLRVCTYVVGSRTEK